MCCCRAIRRGQSLKYLLALFNRSHTHTHTHTHTRTHWPLRSSHLSAGMFQLMSWVDHAGHKQHSAVWRVTWFHTGHLGLQASSLPLCFAGRCAVITKRHRVDPRLDIWDKTPLVGLRWNTVLKCGINFIIFATGFQVSAAARRWGLRCSGMLGSVDRYLVTDVAVQPIRPIFQGLQHWRWAALKRR
jgi:hypothetical protein